MQGDAMDIVPTEPVEAPAAAPASASTSAGGIASSIAISATWRDNRQRDENEAFKDVLSDQGFSIADYGDPLTTVRPLQKQYARAFPDGTEEYLQGVAAKLKESSS